MAGIYRSYREEDPQDLKFRKLFLGGLNYGTTETIIKQYFEQWGEVVDCIVMKHTETRKSRGFGFVTYGTSEMLDAALANRPHKLDNRELDTKRAMPHNENPISVKKLFVGGLKADVAEYDVMKVFSRFGNIEKLEIITDKNTGKRRGFCFVTFDDFDSVDKCVLKQRICLNGNYVEVKKAFSRDPIARMTSERGNGGMVCGTSFSGNYIDRFYQRIMGYLYNMGAAGWPRDYSNRRNHVGAYGDMRSCHGGPENFYGGSGRGGFGGDINNGCNNFGSVYVPGYHGVARGPFASGNGAGCGGGMPYRR